MSMKMEKLLDPELGFFEVLENIKHFKENNPNVTEEELESMVLELDYQEEFGNWNDVENAHLVSAVMDYPDKWPEKSEFQQWLDSCTVNGVRLADM